MCRLKGQGKTTREIKKDFNTKENISAVINLMCDQGLLMRGESKYGWRSTAYNYYPFHEYFPKIDLNDLDEFESKRSIIKQYLFSFGPVTEKDAAWWTGLSVGEVKNIFESFKKGITPVEISGIKGKFFMLVSDKKHLLSMKISSDHTINLLPVLDPYIMGYKDRERYLDQEFYNRIYDRTGNSTSTILLDGRVAGTWDYNEQNEPEVKVFFFRKINKSVVKEIFSEAKKVGRFIADRGVHLKLCESMIPLPQRTVGSFMSPLRDS